MIGVVSIVMISNKVMVNMMKFITRFLFCSFILSLTSTALASLQSTVIVGFIPPSCNLNVPARVDLGTLLPSFTKEHTPIDVQLNCGSNVSTVITIETTNTVVDNNTALLMSNGKTKMWFLSGNTQVPLAGGSNSFCDFSAASKTCKLTPVTQVGSSDPKGQVQATLNFNFLYN